MKRIFAEFAYGPGPRAGCWWDETIAAPAWPVLQGAVHADVAIIGAGFTGLSAALHLAEAGATVAVLEAGPPGWGASGRNGGFCCLGGARIGATALTRKYGHDAARSYFQAEKDAVDLVGQLLKRHNIQADLHSNGETQMAHRARDMNGLRAAAETLWRNGGSAELIEAADLPAAGMAGPFHGALTTKVGFALNPRKYLFGLSRAAQAHGAILHRDSPAQRIERHGASYRIATRQGHVLAPTVLIATNGYSSEDLPTWLAGRYMPSQSNVLVTRPLTDEEIAAQGWNSDQMAYDTRNLLHYFRLMPDRRFLFGMRGGLMSSPRAERRAQYGTRRNFEQMFPAWRDVPSPWQWSGMVCLSRHRVPYVGPVPDHPGMFAGLAYHGNGIAMGSYAGRVLADLALSREPATPCLSVIASPMKRFPFGSLRRVLMPAAYLFYGLHDI
ncbi:NAD(P)/FAD-dependent oxidoreductase [Sedimentitalea nanhaiensis]|uniref:Glycine/D-amino acid oxidase n=1 Tax=Sedimentitalea nanhaiensis TaxID=999627 RepID=A0A1I7C9V7_9RHOB|nr:FAD-binding oxidoreductase [Sedimentitalea nanhaiensis]SFT96202.1 Glycine/D-amino acid oxidase [Sedimentitalea nanhaiensis]